MPWPLQVIFWVQLAGLVLDLAQLLVPAHGKPRFGDVAAYVVLAAVVVFLMLKLRAGRGWTRSVITLIAGLSLLFVLLWLLAGHVPPAGIAVSTAVMLVLLYWPSSNAFFAASKQARNRTDA